ncbi:MAG: hypothetical protein Sapg2KO_06390 [Saprospiraceae bacterium]
MSLKTTEQQTAYLEAIYELDQDVRNFETEQMEKYGYNSPEHQQSILRIMEIDKNHLAKIEAYFAAYGHPKKDIHGKSACGVPWLVIHHAPSETAPRRRNFPTIYRAYKDGDITDTDITFYLNRMHENELGYRIQWEGAYRVDQELDTLFRALDIQGIVSKIDAEQ